MFEDLSQRYNMMKHLDFVPKPKYSACIIGAGCSIQNSGLGGKIDSHSNVVRVNGHNTKKHKKDVGTKCTILCTFRCPFQFKVCLKTIQTMRELWIFEPDCRRIELSLSREDLRNSSDDDVPIAKSRLLEFDTQSYFFFGSPPWTIYPNVKEDKQNGKVLDMVEYYKQQPHLSNKILKRPSTGIITIAMAIYRWGSVSIAGFGKRDSVRLGYYDKRLTNAGIMERKKNTVHDYEDERLLLNEWEKKSLIKRLDDPK